MADLDRRRVLTLLTGLALAGLGACAEDGASGSASSPGPGSVSRGTDGPTWRPAGDVPVEADGASRGITQVHATGETVTAGGARVTVPAGAQIEQGEDSDAPTVTVHLPGAVNGLPGVRLKYVPAFGRSLLEETYAQEVMLAGEGQANRNVLRSRESWPGSKEAYLITWSTSTSLEDGSNLDIDSLGLWVADGGGGGWIVYASAAAGELTAQTGVWKTAMTLEVAP